MKISQNFLAFSEYMNFNYIKIASVDSTVLGELVTFPIKTKFHLLLFLFPLILILHNIKKGGFLLQK